MKVRFTKRGVLVILGIAVVFAAAAPLVLPLFFPDMRANGLVRKFESNNDATRQKAADELVKIGRPAAEPLVEGLRRKARQVHGPGPWRSIIERVFGKPNPEVHLSIINTLARIGEPAMDALEEGFNDDDRWVHEWSDNALSRIGGPRAREVWLAALSGPWSDVSYAAELHMVFSRDPRAVAPLVAHLWESEEKQRWRTAWVLETIGLPEAQRAVAAFVKETGADELSRSYRDVIRNGAVDTWILRFILERYGTLEMAADYNWCDKTELCYFAQNWAERHGLFRELLDSADPPERPKWGAAAPTKERQE